MSTSPAPAGRQRRFTASEEKGLGKGFWISVLLLALAATVGLFIWLLWPQSGTRVLFTALVVGNYNDAEGLNDPAYAAWDFAGLQRRLAERYLVPWEPFFSDEAAASRDANGVVENAEQINSVAEGWAAVAEAAKLGKHDTLVVYLRGHCLVDPASEGAAVWFLAGEFVCSYLTERETQSLPQGAVDLAKLLERLSQLPAGQVVVLFDGCDQSHLPGAGVLVNPVAAAVARCCGKLPASAPLWVVTASASLQPTHVSDLRRRTLLQSAAEYAAQVNPDDPDAKTLDSASQDGLITLDEFYDRLLRYACKVTDKRQTPLLFAAGSEQPVTPDANRDRWASAGGVAMGRVDVDGFRKKKKADEAREAEQAGRQVPRAALALAFLPPSSPGIPVFPEFLGREGSGEGGRGGNHAGARFANHSSHSTRSSVQEPNTSAPQTGASPATTGQIPATQQPAANPVNPSLPQPAQPKPWDRFWQACDQLALRSGGAGFAPVDFAPHLWHELRASAVRISRLDRIRAADNGSVAGRIAVALESQLVPAMKEGLPRSVPAENPADEARLLNAWNGLLNRLGAIDSGTAAWKNPERLPAEHVDGWRERRGMVRDQATALARLRDWLDLALDRPELAGPVRSLAQGLAEQFRAPSVTAEIIANPAVERDSAVLSTARESTRGLLATLDRVATAELAPLRTKLEKKERLTWRDEWLLQQWLDSALLDWDQRMALGQLLAGLNVNDHVAEPGRNDLHVDSASDRIADLLAGVDNQNGPPDFLSGRQAWAEAVNQLAGTATGWASLATPGADLQSLNTWSRDVLGRLNRSTEAAAPPVGNRPGFEAWIEANWKGLFRVQPRADLIAGVVADFQLDGTLFLKGASPLTITNDPDSQRWPLQIRRADGRRLEETSLKWIPDAGASAADPIVSYADQERKAGEWIDLGDLPTGEAMLTIRPGGPSDEAVSSRIQWVAASSPADEASHSAFLFLTVDPPNPDRVDLAMNWLNPPADATDTALDCVLHEGESLRRLEKPLAVPAVGAGVFSRYELTLVNRSSSERQVRVTIYAVDPPSGTSRFGTGDDWNPDWAPQPEDAIFVETAPVTLPGAPTGGGGLSPKRVPLKLAKPEPSTNFHGLLCVVHDVRQEGDQWLDTGPKFRFWLSCRAENPYDVQLVRLTAVEANEELRLRGEIEELPKARFNIKDMLLQLEIRDFAGKPLRNGDIKARLESGNNYGHELSFAHKEITENSWTSPALGAVSMGEYQRAALFSSSLKTSDKAQRVATTLARLDLAGMNLVEPEAVAGGTRAKAEPFPDEAGNWIVPVRTGAAWNEEGHPVDLDGIVVPVRFDLAPGAVPDLEVRLLAGPTNDLVGSLPLRTDRLFVPSWRATVDGDLEFGCRAEDIEYLIENPGGLTGLCRLEVVNRRDPKPLATGQIVFDRTPPEEPIVKVADARPMLYQDSQLVFSVQPHDELTSVRDVWFALRADNEREYTYDRPPIHEKRAKSDGGVWKLTLKGEDMQGQPSGFWRVVTRCVDAAGNVQDSCTAKIFEWRDEPKPKSSGSGEDGD